MTSNCIICDTPFIPTSVRRKTCSSACARENKQLSRRRKELRRADRKAQAARVGKRCRVCNVDISHRHGTARYCSKTCWETGYQPPPQPPSPSRPRLCLRCSEPISKPRLVCDGCLKPKSWEKWNNKPRTIEEKIAVNEQKKQIVKQHTRRVRAAYAVYCELMGKTKKAPSPLLPAATCVVCGIVITGRRKRILCSKACAVTRGREIHSCRYYCEPAPATPRMIATAEWSKQRGARKFRDIHKNRPPQTEASRARRRRSQRRMTVVYKALTELGLIEMEN